MLRWLGLLFVVVPLIEVWLLIELSHWVGFGPTLLLSILTGVWGASLARREGLRTWRKLGQSLERMQAPERALVEGALVLVGGVLLITPGILTDCVGFLLLVPATRGALATLAASQASAHVSVGSPQRPVVQSTHSPGRPVWRPPTSAPYGVDVIETTGKSVD